MPLHSNGNHYQREMTTCRIGENIFKLLISQETISRMCKKFINSVAKEQYPDFKMDDRSKLVFLKRLSKDQQVLESMLTIYSHQGTANQNHNEVSLHPSKNGGIKITKDSKCW
jgi:hypothetical protein